MKAQWGECENVLRGFLNLINLKVYSCRSIMVKLDKWLSTKRYCTFVQSWSILWLATTNYFLVTTGRETQCAWMDLLWKKLFYSMVPQALWVFILVSLVLASLRHWNKRLAIVTASYKEYSEVQDHKTVDPGTYSFIATGLQFPHDEVDDLQKSQSIGSVDSYEQCETEETVTKSRDVGTSYPCQQPLPIPPMMPIVSLHYPHLLQLTPLIILILSLSITTFCHSFN